MSRGHRFRAHALATEPINFTLGTSPSLSTKLAVQFLLFFMETLTMGNQLELLEAEALKLTAGERPAIAR